MTIGFNGIPTSLRVPFVFVEFDNAAAQQGPSIQAFKTLILGQKRAAGTLAELTLTSVTSEAQARTLFGVGSMLHLMIAKYLENDKVTELKAMAIDDNAAGTAATGKIAITAGTATADGVLSVYIAGQLVSVSVATGDDQDDVATALAAAITALTTLPVTAVVNGVNDNEVDLTCRHKGLVGNEIDVRLNYYEEDAYPAGIAATITAMSGGLLNPDVDEIVAALPEDQFNIIVHPWTDAGNLGKLETELADRFGPIRQNDGVAITAKLDALVDLQSLGNARNSPHSSIFGPAISAPNWAPEWAAAAAGQIAKAGQQDPARPFQTLPLNGILLPKENERFLLSERNILLTDGIATVKVADVVRIERAITTYQTNAASAPDTSYLDINTMLTLSYLRYDFRNTMLRKYPRHKLASDGTRVAPGQPIITPKIGRAEAVAKFAQWAELGLVEGIEQFKRDLIVERNIQDVNRLDFLLPPDLVNQLRVIGAKIQFLL